MINVYDNFLPEYYFKQLQSIVLGNEYCWYYQDRIDIRYETDLHYFIHFYYKDNAPTTSYHQIDPCIPFFNMKKIYRIKVNLYSKTVFHRNTGWHTDYKDITTSILYMNTNNGWTEFKNGDKVESVENRLVIFDSDLEHAGVTCTDEKRRVVINFNYV